MPTPNIPDEAVAEARKAIERQFPYDENNGYIVQLALDAAAPHLMAGAWDEGYEVGVREEQPGWTSNPYRSSGAGE